MRMPLRVPSARRWWTRKSDRPAEPSGDSFRPRQGQRDLAGDGGGEPFRAPEPPGAVRAVARDRRRPRDIAPTRTLRHPLAAGPELAGVAAGEVRHHAPGEVGARVLDQRARGAVRHREVARVDRGARPIEGEEDELVEAREGTQVALVRDGGQAPLGGCAMESRPRGRDADLVHARAPRVVRNVARRIALGFARQGGQRARRRLAQVAPDGEEPAVEIGRQQTLGRVTEGRVRLERVRPPRRVLEELRRRVHGGHGASIPLDIHCIGVL